MSVLKVDVRPGETITFGEGGISVTMKAKSGQRARLEIHADDDVAIQLPKRARVSDVVQNGVSISSTRAGSGGNNSGSKGGKSKGPPRRDR